MCVYVSLCEYMWVYVTVCECMEVYVGVCTTTFFDDHEIAQRALHNDLQG